MAARSPVLVPVRNLEREAQFEWPFKSSSRCPSSAEVGPVGIEPTSSGLRDRCITLSATVPVSRRGGSRTPNTAAERWSLELIRLPLSPLSYAPQRVGPVGFEPTPIWLKARDAAVTPRPHTWSGVCVSIDVRQASSNSFVSWFTSGSPENRTQRNAVISRVWATSPRLPLESGTSESNRDPPAPKAGVLPSAPLPDC